MQVEKSIGMDQLLNQATLINCYLIRLKKNIFSYIHVLQIVCMGRYFILEITFLYILAKASHYR